MRKKKYPKTANRKKKNTFEIKGKKQSEREKLTREIDRIQRKT